MHLQLLRPSFRATAFLAALMVFLGPMAASAAEVGVRFDLGDPGATPFPSNLFTVRAPEHLTGRRVSLPLPDCGQQPSDCHLIEAINTLDGFNLQPRLSIPFSGAIDPATATSKTVFLVPLSGRSGSGASSRMIGIEQVVWDPATSTLHAESDDLLEQHASYALIVTRGVRDRDGQPVRPEPFRQFLRQLWSTPERTAYAADILQSLGVAGRVGVYPQDIVCASVFTTQSATAVLEKIRRQIKSRVPEPADFFLADSSAAPTLFPIGSIADITFRYQHGSDPSSAGSFLDLPVYDELLASGLVSAIAFGKFVAPSYRDPGDLVIPAIGTRRGQPEVQAEEEVFFNLFLPSRPKPAAGWPVAIYAHGDGPGKNFESFAVANALAEKGIAIIAVNAVGYGGGPHGTLTVARVSAPPVTFSAGGRGLDVDGDGSIGDSEGYAGTLLPTRDGRRQTVVDLMQLVRVIEVGMDADGDGKRDLDPSRISYLGVSLGGYHGPIFLAVEPRVRSGVINTGGGADIDLRLSVDHRPDLELILAQWQPPLTNVGDPPSCVEGGICDLRFDESLPLRHRPPIVEPAAGALAIQEAFERAEWLSQSGNPAAYAPHLRAEPLTGLKSKAVLFQMARGDMSVPNPSTTAVLRAGRLANATTLYRHDLVFGDPNRPGSDVRDGHPFLFFGFFPEIPGPSDIGLGAQQQMAEFLASEGRVLIDPDGTGPVFEVPIASPLPEDCGFVGELPPGFTACR